MYRNAVGFNPSSSILKGLKGTPNYGKAMAAAATMDFEADIQNKQSMSKQDTQQKQLDMKKDQQNAQQRGQSQQYNQNKKKNMMAQAQTHASGKSAEIGAKRRMYTQDETRKKNALLDGLIGA